jgi:hypothetical protein
MGYDEGVAQRLREALAHRDDVVEKKMFGGLAFMVAGHMCCGVVDDTLMARVGPDAYEQALARPEARVMDFTGLPLRGFVYVGPAGFESDAALAGWVDLCARFVGGLPSR